MNILKSFSDFINERKDVERFEELENYVSDIIAFIKQSLKDASYDIDTCSLPGKVFNITDIVGMDARVCLTTAFEFPGSYQEGKNGKPHVIFITHKLENRIDDIVTVLSHELTHMLDFKRVGEPFTKQTLKLADDINKINQKKNPGSPSINFDYGSKEDFDNLVQAIFGIGDAGNKLYYTANVEYNAFFTQIISSLYRQQKESPMSRDEFLKLGLSKLKSIIDFYEPKERNRWKKRLYAVWDYMQTNK
jgi:hypothetical protein